MKKLYNFTIIVLLVAATGCNVLDHQPADRVSADVVFSSKEGIRAFLSSLYSFAPWQDFCFNWTIERNYVNTVNTLGFHQDQFTDNAIHSEGNAIGLNFGYWTYRYMEIRNVNYLFDEIENVGYMTENEKDILRGEAHFLRGWTYFDLAKKYGGVPLIKKSQDFDGDVNALRVPRSTEKETWDFVMEDLQAAADLLPETRAAEDIRFANKYVALSMLSRAALFAASIAQFGDRVTLEGAAASQKLVGIDAEYADDYYQICLDASKEVIESGRFSLYGATPANKDEAVANLMALFQDPNIAPQEGILVCGYAPNGNGHQAEIWWGPYQTRESSPHPGRICPSIDLVDNYESYSTPGEDSPLQTREDGDMGNAGYDSAAEYLHFTNAFDIFADKDARLWSTVVLPFTEWKGKTIRIQNGFILENGTPDIGGAASSATKNGATYYKFGAASPEDYSGYDQTMMSPMTRSGFCFKKFLTPGTAGIASQTLGYSTQDFAEIRYAEVLLNYAEAAAESGLGDQALARQCLNATRRRAAFMTDIPLTSKNVQRERRSEFAFENKRFDDLIRRREFHLIFDHALVNSFDPVLDMRTDPPQFIFVRKLAVREDGLSWTFDTGSYYCAIPDIASNGLVQNPKY